MLADIRKNWPTFSLSYPWFDRGRKALTLFSPICLPSECITATIPVWTVASAPPDRAARRNKGTQDCEGTATGSSPPESMFCIMSEGFPKRAVASGWRYPYNGEIQDSSDERVGHSTSGLWACKLCLHSYGFASCVCSPAGGIPT